MKAFFKTKENEIWTKIRRKSSWLYFNPIAERLSGQLT